DPLNHTCEIIPGTERYFDLKTKNKRLFEEIYLDEFLTNGKGWVVLDSYAKTPSYWDNKLYLNKHYMSVQVTDLGITARYGINKAVVFVTSIQTGKPIKDADVFLFGNKTEAPTNINNTNAFACAKTDKFGLAILHFDNMHEASYFFKNNQPSILVRTNDDKAVFKPQSHNAWREGIYNTTYTEYAAERYQRTFMFTDRGLYQPGETVTYRGIDRDQQMGVFTPYTDSYTVNVEEDVWYNPKTILTHSGTASESGGFWDSFIIPKKTEPGNYSITYKRSNSDKKQRLRFTVAYFERLKYQTAISLPQTPVISGSTVSGTIKATYLSGGGLSNAHYEGAWFKSPYRFTSEDPAFKNITFCPLVVSGGSKKVDEFSGNLSATGEASISCKTGTDGLYAVPYRYVANCNVTDTSNQLIACAKDVIVHPASVYIGVSKPIGISGFPKSGRTVSFKYILAAPTGKPLADLSKAASNVKVELIRENWKVVQQRGAEGSIYSSYVKEDIVESTQTLKAKLNDTIAVKPTNAGVYRIKVTGADTEGRPASTEYQFYVTGSNYFFWNRYNASSIRLTPNQSMYNPGDTAEILLESPLPSGDYLITVEREGIFTEEIQHFDESCATFKIPIANNYVPVVYVSISSYSTRTKKPEFEYGEEDTDKPKAYYGVTALQINPRVKAFSVSIESEQPSYLPGKEARITLRATKGGQPLKNAELTLMAVDRGVLDLINYHVPNPIDFFYNASNFPLACYGGDSRSMLMDPVTYEIKNLLGGDGEDDDKDDERKDFNPTAVFLPDLRTDENGEVTATFILPDSLTTYRVTAFGVHDELLALQESEIAVQNPINVSAVMPRRLRERDTAEAGVLLYNFDGKSHRMTVSASVRDPEQKTTETGLAILSGKALIDGKNTHTIDIASGQNAVVYFDLTAEKSGTIEIVFSIQSDILTEKLVQSIEIEKPYITETFTSFGIIGSKDKKATEGIAIPSFAEDGRGSVSITLDATRLGPLSDAVQYVFDYPYDCMEQQAAAIYPLIAFDEYIDIFGMDNKIHDIKKYVHSTFSTWKNVQLDDGGFPYWPKGTKSDFYVSLRIAHIAVLAQSRNYNTKEIGINTDMLLEYLESYRHLHGYYLSDYLKTYYYYVISLYGKAVSPSSLYTIYTNNDSDVSILALMGMTYLNSQDTKNAQKCAEHINRYLRPTARGAELTKAEEWSGRAWYSNDISEDYALAMQLLVQLNSEDEMVTRLLYTLLETQKSGYWRNTTTTARVLDAVHTLIKCRKLDNTNFNAKAIFENTVLAEGTFKGVAAKPITATIAIDEAPLSNAKKDTVIPLEFTKKGTGTLYYTTSLTYSIPEEMQVARDEGIGIHYVITDTETGDVLAPENAQTPIITLESGKTYSMEITIDSGRDRTHLALCAPIPSGAEVLDTNFVTTPGGQKELEATDYNKASWLDEWQSYWYDYWYGGNWMSNEQIFDNEVRYFWDVYHKGSTKASFKFRAARRGVYPVPPATAHCMYETEVFGRTNGYLFIIK
ncbi:MAG TPA: MG2 domain-containing protein, partial [Treponemataceae bacterium]|nr:MG2 domain-containing protein [Treponemataceae bacterium]